MTEDDSSSNLLRSVCHKILSIFFVAKDSYVMYRLIYLLFGVLGVSVSPFFFSFHLFELVSRSDLLKYVIQAVTTNGRSIILTVCILSNLLNIYNFTDSTINNIGHLSVDHYLYIFYHWLPFLPQQIYSGGGRLHMRHHANVFYQRC